VAQRRVDDLKSAVPLEVEKARRAMDEEQSEKVREYINLGVRVVSG